MKDDVAKDACCDFEDNIVTLRSSLFYKRPASGRALKGLSCVAGVDSRLYICAAECIPAIPKNSHAYMMYINI